VAPLRTVRLITAHFDSIARYLNPLGLGGLSGGPKISSPIHSSRHRGTTEDRSFANPLILLRDYTLVFGVILRGVGDNPRAMAFGISAVALFGGLVVINAFAECASRATGLIVSVPIREEGDGDQRCRTRGRDPRATPFHGESYRKVRTRLAHRGLAVGVSAYCASCARIRSRLLRAIRAV